MNHLTERRPSRAGRIRVLAIAFALVLAGATLAGAQVDLINSTSVTLAPNPNDPNTWPATFNGAPAMGPYAWVDGPTHLQKDPQLASGVFAGQEGTRKMFVCRVKQSDGMHPGKFFDGYCNIGWGGKEISLTSGYEVLVNTQPQNAKFLTQTWVSPATAASATFTGGSVGTTAMRVARASYNNSVHPGKEWAGKCYIGFGGQEVAVAPYEVLVLGFDKAAWQAAQPPPPYNPNDPNSWPATFDGVNALGPYAWTDGPAALQKDPSLANGVRSDGGGGWFKPVLARARQTDGGLHPGQYSDYFKKFSIGWGGKEVVLTDGYEVLVNSQPSYARFLTQTWSDARSADAGTTFKGGSVGSTQMRVCRTLHDGLFLVGKEWAGKCNLGWKGQEVPVDNYQVLTLGFDKAAWQAAGSPISMNLDLNLTPSPLPQITFDQGTQVQIGKILRNVFVMRVANNPDVCVGVAVPDYHLNAKPGVARSLVKEGTSLRTYNWGVTPAGGLPGCVTTLPGAWFVQENGQAGWFRLKWFDTNLCLNAASNTEGASVQLATCNGSVNQSWTLGHAGTTGNLDVLKSALQVDNNTLTSLISDYGKYLFLTSKDGNLVLSGQSYLSVTTNQFPEWVFQEDMIGGHPK